MKKFDINVVNYNSTDHLLKCLESIEKSLKGISADFFIQDNASTDNVDRILSEFNNVVVNTNPKNLGFAKAVNHNLKRCKAPYIVLLNPDTYVAEGFFESVLNFMDNRPDVGIIGPKILNADGSVQGSARSFPSPLTGLFGRTSFFTRWFPKNKISRNNLLIRKSDGFSPMEVDWVSGACMVVRKQAIEEVGPMDERFFMYWEDADWCRRMWNHGWKVVYYPVPSIVHLVGKSSEKRPIRSIIEFHKSSFRLFAKYAKGYARYAIPLAICGLSLRLFIILISRGIPQYFRWGKSSY